jgi:hypothetical protein
MALEFSRIVITTPLVSLETAKQHLRITGTDHDADIQQKLTASQDRIVTYLGAAADATWTEATVPTPVAEAILKQLAEFFRFRGDDYVGNEPGAPTVESWATIERLLSMYRDPTLA